MMVIAEFGIPKMAGAILKEKMRNTKSLIGISIYLIWSKKNSGNWSRSFFMVIVTSLETVVIVAPSGTVRMQLWFLL